MSEELEKAAEAVEEKAPQSSEDALDAATYRTGVRLP